MPSWVEALKEWNSGKQTWCIPRRGTPGHAEVLRIMRQEEAPKKAAKAPKVPPEVRAMIREAKEDFDGLDWRDKTTVLTALEKYNLRPPASMKKMYQTWVTSRAHEKARAAKTTGKGRSRMEYCDYE